MASIRKFSVPGDLPRLAALGLARPLEPTEWSERYLRNRLNNIMEYLDNGCCPDLGEERIVLDGRTWNTLVHLPSELAEHAKDLKTGVADCLAMLDRGEPDAARARMKGVERLVSYIAERADPDRRCGHKVRAGQRAGGKERAQQGQEKKRRVRELLHEGLSSEEVAIKLQKEGHKISSSGVRKIKHRWFRSESPEP